MSDERINSTKTPNQSITPKLDYYGTKTIVEFDGNCLKQDKVTFNNAKVVNIYLVYEISKAANISKYRLKKYRPSFGLEQLVWLNMLITIRTNILDMELDLIEDQDFHFQVVDLAKM